ncbi:MAG TPA: DUF2130 domain-containing protein [Anaerohalosphaeraceae bacterium]|nr:DUF2130 domain-containing protein [Anaerohalosphaeraceae bacterium]HRT49415.1 DUF2130 domain-containing protein [Anaerohalosphaeraceae bacterium]HRT87409.1 DUF2130 domain-containing protein [Anaerohalosphaeraceae bacterium]
MANGETIKCPECGAEIALSEALTGQIEASLKARYEAEAVRKEKELAAQLKVVHEKEKQLEQKREAIEAEVAERLKSEKKKLGEEALVKARAEEAERRKALEGELAQMNEKLRRTQAEELALRKKQRELEQQAEELELTVQRKLDEERKKITEDALRRAAEAQELKMREKDDQLASLRKQVEDMQRKMEQGSQERQGEMMEEALKDVLRERFPYDRFEDVAKGSRGADILQVVYGPTGKVCGRILWESKNTKEFSKAWTEKLKSDQMEAGADFAVLMTVAMPREVRDFDYYDDVWVTNYRSAIGLCTALREGLIRLARQKAVDAGQGSMKDFVYEYVTGPEFSRRIKMIVTAYTQMQNDLEGEKRSMQRIWKKRERQIAAVLQSAAEIRGELEALVGGYKMLPKIEELTLEGLVEGEDEDVTGFGAEVG